MPGNNNILHHNGEEEMGKMGESPADEMELFDYIFFFFMPLFTLIGLVGNILVIVIGN